MRSGFLRTAARLASVAFAALALHGCGGGGGGANSSGSAPPQGSGGNNPQPAAGTLPGQLLFYDISDARTYLGKADASTASTTLTMDGGPKMWPDGSQYLEYTIGAGGNGTDQITVYATGTRQVIYQVNNVPYYCGTGAHPSPVSKKRIVTQCYQELKSNQGLVAVFDLESGTVAYYENDQPQLYGYRWLPDGRLLRVQIETGALDVKAVGAGPWQTLGRIAVPSGRRIQNLQVNPQGTMLAFSFQGYIDYEKAIESGESDIWVSKLDGSSLEQFTAQGWVYDPVWSPDGAYIAFATDTGRGCSQLTHCTGAPFLWFAPASARNMTQIVDGIAHPSATQLRRRYPSGNTTVLVGVNLTAWVQ